MFVYLVSLLAFRFQLKRIDRDTYIGQSNGNITFVDPDEADIFELENTDHPNEDFVMVRSKDNKVWDISGNATKLIYWSDRHGKVNQRFTLLERPQGHVKVVSDMKLCITFDQSANNFVRAPCDDNNPHQLFDFVGVESESQPEGVVVEESKLNALKMAASNCPEIRDMLGMEFIMGV
ncbi:hypothetical protein VCUG_01246 [Vavraia culicis subsp. floridensis]|uniref:Ricin B lectin domain-containing protein n=1 Tax=Vavraia culicis (isolate floridensis) TaxID=948595 RepID=L2GVW3_VAVCU|nr:uncharacterized protein VCUG_01246 [Vavraia culicis subsp. floridensis]ELA47250.1 hypothetical protein VCUG_01246 [Vavraia culicis subsp. floridensis]